MIRIAIGTLIVGVVLAIASADAMTTCKSSAPRGVAASYQLIDGRKCWYAGKHHVDKAQLTWGRVARAEPMKRKPAMPAAKIRDVEITGSNISGFEARWQILAPVEWASAIRR